MKLNVIQDEADKLRAAEEPFVIATVVAYKSPQSARPGSKAIITADGNIDGWIGGGCVQPIVIREAQKALQTGKPKLISISPESAHGDWKGVESYNMTCQGGGSLEIYLEPVLPKPELLIVGNSPIARILAGIGKLLDFKVCVADPDATAEGFPEADLVLTDLERARGRIRAGTCVVVATMGTGDEEGLLAVAGTDPLYLGFVASKEKARGLFEYLREKGVSAENLDRFKCPAGLELGAETLPEIALSVMAEITRLRRSTREPEREEAVQSKIRPKRAVLPVMPSTQPADPAGESSQALPQEPLQHRDPVCGMTVDARNAKYTFVSDRGTVYFCCLRCKETFERAPQSYPL